MVKQLFKFFVLVVIGFSCSTKAAKDVRSGQKEEFQPGKITGLSFVAPPKEIDPSSLQPVLRISAEWLCLMPYAFCRSEQDATVQYDYQWQWWGEKTDGTISCIQMAKEKGLKILLKPHLWIGHGKFTGSFEPRDELEWNSFEKSYEEYLLHYAGIAQQYGVEMLCIGVEMENYTQKRISAFKELINKVKEVYTGEITYAANWDEYRDFPFWNDMDYIGVDAYFPLSDKKNPGEKELIKSWNALSKELKGFSEGLGKDILFTELGYRSCNYNCKEPWNSERINTVNLENQRTAYKAFFKSIWKEDFLSGVFLWKWYPNYSSSGGKSDSRFTPQNKPAEEIIAQYFSNKG